MYYLGAAQELLTLLVVVQDSADDVSSQKLYQSEMASNNNNNTLNTTVTVFAGMNFRAWQQSMGDYLKSQKLWCHATGVVTRPVAANPAAPTAAELVDYQSTHVRYRIVLYHNEPVGY